MFIRFAVAIIAVLLFTVSAYAGVVTMTIPYKEGTTMLEGTLVYDDAKSGPRPGVLVFHAWMGPGAHELKQAKQLAGLGYAAFIADVYGKDIRPKDSKEASAMSGKYKADRTTLRARARAAYDEFRISKLLDTTRLSAIGYCFGGLTVLELARTGADLRSVVVFHGALDSPAPQDGRNIKAKLLILHGADDPFVPAPDIAAFEDELRKAGVDWQMTFYGGAVHSFTDEGAGSDNSKGAAYNPVAYRRSWKAMQEFLEETIGSKAL